MSFASQRALGSAWLTQPPVIVLSQPSSFLTCGSNTRPHPTHSHPFSTPKPEPSFQIYIHSVPSTSLLLQPQLTGRPLLQSSHWPNLQPPLTLQAPATLAFFPFLSVFHGPPTTGPDRSLFPQLECLLLSVSLSVSLSLSHTHTHTHTLLSSRSPSSSQLKCRPPSAPATPV